MNLTKTNKNIIEKFITPITLLMPTTFYSCFILTVYRILYKPVFLI